MKVTALREREGEEYHFILQGFMLGITKGFISNDAPIQDLIYLISYIYDACYG